MANTLKTKHIAPIIGFGFLAVASLAQAGTVGNPTATLPQGSIRVGADLEFNERDFSYENVSLDSVEYNRYQARASYGFSDTVEVFAKSGVGSMASDGDDFDEGLTIGGGVKATLMDMGELKIGAVAQALYQYNEYTEGYYNRYYRNVSANYDISTLELEIGVGASYELNNMFTPYGGVIYSNAEIEIEGTANYSSYTYRYLRSQKYTLESEDNFGIFVGTDIKINHKLDIGVELRLVHESSLSVLANFTL